MTNYERQKRWREKHRGLANLRRREAYKRVKDRNATEPEPVKVEPKPELPKNKTLEALRALMAAESEKPAQVETPVAPKIFRDDYGRVITEAQWNQLQKRKLEAAEGGYTLDEFSQF